MIDADTSLPPGATERLSSPTGWHVHVLVGGNVTPAREPEVWYRYAALYGAYAWRVATVDEIAQAQAAWAECAP